MLGHRVALAECTREMARGTESFSGQATYIWVVLAGTGYLLALAEGAEVEDAVDVFELLSFGRDRKNYVNMNTRVCVVYCDILFYKIFADEQGVFMRCHQTHGTVFKNIAEEKTPHSIASCTLHSFTSWRIPVVPGAIKLHLCKETLRFGLPCFSTSTLQHNRNKNTHSIAANKFQGMAGENDACVLLCVARTCLT